MERYKIFWEVIVVIKIINNGGISVKFIGEENL